MTPFEHIAEQFKRAYESEADVVIVDIEELASILAELRTLRDAVNRRE